MILLTGNLTNTGQFLTLEMPAHQDDATESVEPSQDSDFAELIYAAAMQRELEEIQEALDEISQYVIY